MSDPGLWIALAACLIGCYFGACNVALKSFSRARLGELLEDQGRSGRLEPFVQRVPRLLLMTGALRSGSGLVVLLAIIWLMEGVATGWLRSTQYLVALLISGLLVSVFLVAIPISWARYRSENLLARSILLLTVCLKLFTPMARILELFDPLIRRVTGAQANGRGGVEISEEVLSVVEEHEDNGNVDESQRQMIEAVFDFSSTTAGEIMTPRTDVVGIEIDASIDEIRSTIVEYGHSRIPVYEQSLDHILGMLYVKDLLDYLGTDKKLELRKILRHALMVPESKAVRDLLAEFKARKVHIAIVLDEYGGTAGLITIEDILEELVGDIQDEYESAEEPPAIERIDATVAEVDARMHIDDLNDQLDIELPEDEDYDTLGGFVFSTLGHIPEVGERFQYEQIAFTVTDAERTKVKRVRVELPGRAAETAPADDPVGT